MNSLGSTRRGFLQIGVLGLGGLTLGGVMRARANEQLRRSSATRPTSVILLWLEGGPSQLETYDLKPNAPAEIRGEFRPIRTTVPGMDICELMPRQARIAKRFSLIRSISHRIVDHPGAAARFLSGYVPANISDPISKYPTIEAVTAKMRAGAHPTMPAHVSNLARLKGGGSAYLGRAVDPFVVDRDPSLPQFRVDALDLDDSLANRLDDRKTLLQSLDSWQRGAEQHPAFTAQDSFQHRAFQLLTGSATRTAFDLNQESPRVRDAYGRHEWGQRTLLARRLVEAGCSFVTVQLTGKQSSAFITWDDHGDVGHIFRNMKQRLPLLDQSVAALIEDLHARGLEREVLVVVAGEFGRTPVVNMGRAAKPVHPGRDHWPHAMSVLVAGGGWQMGQVVGSTDSRGAEPHSRPLEPNDLLASVYHFLGIDSAAVLHDAQGRPIPILPSGSPIPELVGTSPS
ncbi:DUF1501 domain-containing protein [Tuwongella immobilis]|uniref:DUF1501 domain-containing protein n=1 Tax=Tuwongella immobilis TaxID=692036 RepID=A0A6C2YWD3_9BACT|nr:DUF1501 domain-containing protein [Tuwongella immobilis]VIP05172.1 hypothetical protein : Uncharacterized protein OS=Planctomyces maris DSM 8797 GN=PM8797T_11641 PE=4 SV=1: DUF1501 [Tuwongella immobilis]VTS07700.1 hypothetical protein : Uncharacterized protein OS=Planctomyces maris DSM 8797 GN=PM8797T_11641 PE=4 SV=1: DUF1501 [Tuwongella immobilis]